MVEKKFSYCFIIAEEERTRGEEVSSCRCYERQRDQGCRHSCELVFLGPVTTVSLDVVMKLMTGVSILTFRFSDLPYFDSQIFFSCLKGPSTAITVPP